MPYFLTLEAHDSSCKDAQDGLAVLWMTNRERHWRFVETELLPAWDMKIAATWFWLKVTSHGALVGPLVDSLSLQSPMLKEDDIGILCQLTDT